MKVELKTVPFMHILIDDFYNEVQYKSVWKELMHLYPNFGSPSKTHAATDEDGRMLKKGTGAFLLHIYSDLNFSSIEKHTKSNLFSEKFKNETYQNSNSPNTILLKYYHQLDRNKSTILVQHYMNGDYYKPHQDFACLLTSATIMHSKKKKYKGGEYNFPYYNYSVDIKNNQTIIFPSAIHHEITEIKMNSSDPEDGRFSISLFMHLPREN